MHEVFDARNCFQSDQYFLTPAQRGARLTGLRLSGAATLDKYMVQSNLKTGDDYIIYEA